MIETVELALSKIGTLLLASLGGKGKNRNSLACLRNAGSYSAESYCIGNTDTAFHPVWYCPIWATVVSVPFLSQQRGGKVEGAP